MVFLSRDFRKWRIAISQASTEKPSQQIQAKKDYND